MLDTQQIYGTEENHAGRCRRSLPGRKLLRFCSLARLSQSGPEPRISTDTGRGRPALEARRRHSRLARDLPLVRQAEGNRTIQVVDKDAYSVGCPLLRPMQPRPRSARRGRAVRFETDHPSSSSSESRQLLPVRSGSIPSFQADFGPLPNRASERGTSDSRL